MLSRFLLLEQIGTNGYQSHTLEKKISEMKQFMKLIILHKPIDA